MDKKEVYKLVYGLLLGDGSLELRKGRTNAIYSGGQVEYHKDYVDWQVDLLQNITGVNIYYSEPKLILNTLYTSAGFYRIKTAQHPLFSTIHERTYHMGRKTVSSHDLNNLDWHVAAMWYMDDGFILTNEQNREKGNIGICTDNFNEAEIILLRKVLYDKLGISFNSRKAKIRKDGTRSYRIFATKDNAKRFIEGISKYVLPSFYYKLDPDIKSPYSIKRSERLSPQFVDEDIV